MFRPWKHLLLGESTFAPCPNPGDINRNVTCVEVQCDRAKDEVRIYSTEGLSHFIIVRWHGNWWDVLLLSTFDVTQVVLRMKPPTIGYYYPMLSQILSINHAHGSLLWICLNKEHELIHWLSWLSLMKLPYTIFRQTHVSFFYDYYD
jgi:hypothetical protein